MWRTKELGIGRLVSNHILRYLSMVLGRLATIFACRIFQEQKPMGWPLLEDMAKRLLPLLGVASRLVRHGNASRLPSRSVLTI